MDYPNLFSPLVIKKLRLKNRLVMPAMGTNYANHDGSVTERLKAYYAARAAGGVGLIIVEICSVESPRGKSLANQIALDDDRFIPGLRELVDVIHQHDTAAFFQLHHAGKRALKEITGMTPVTSSPISIAPSESGWYFKGGDIPHELTVEEIKHLVYLFSEAARRAKEAGADGVEIHGAHGYLLNQFLSPYSNRRTDAYGGSTEGRTRFPREIVQEVRRKVGEDFPVFFRISAWEGVAGGISLEEVLDIVRILEGAGADAFHVSSGSHDSMYLIAPPAYVPQGHIIHLAAAVKKVVKVPVMTVGRINDPDMAEKAVAEGKADLVATGRALLADPEFPIKAKTGRTAEIRRCIGCNQGCVGRLRLFDDKGRCLMTCTVNPAVGREAEIDLRPVSAPKKVMVIGGGPAGLSVGLTAAMKGHQVTIYEKERQLGGQLLIASKPPFKSEIDNVVPFYENQLKKWNVPVRLGEEVTVETVRKLRPDVILVTTGGKPLIPSIEGIDQSNVVTAWNVLAGKAKVSGRVAVLGGSTTGCEVAHYLADRGGVRGVTIIEQLERIAQGLEINRRHYLRLYLDKLGVKVLTESKVEQIQGKKVIYSSAKNGKGTVQADTIVLAVGVQPEQQLARKLTDAGFKVQMLGDCQKVCDMLQAIADGFNAALNL